MTRKVRAAKSTTAVNGRQAVMFGPCKSDEQSILMIGGSDTSILWAAIPSKPTPERGSRKLEGRKQEACSNTLLKINDRRPLVGTEPGL